MGITMHDCMVCTQHTTPASLYYAPLYVYTFRRSQPRSQSAAPPRLARGVPRGASRRGTATPALHMQDCCPATSSPARAGAKWPARFISNGVELIRPKTHL